MSLLNPLDNFNEFHSFRKIPRLFRDCVISEKIDGTNAQIKIADNGDELLVGSRNRWITPGKQTDNHGFAAWVKDNEDEVRKVGPGSHYGEWWGLGIARNYGLKEKRFTLFNSSVWTPENCPKCMSVVPVLYSGPFTTLIVKDMAYELSIHGSYAAPGFMKPEGIVVYHVSAEQYFKYTYGGDGHKGTVVE